MVYLARYPLYPGFISGGERHIIEVCTRAKTNEWELAVLTCSTGERVLRLNGLAAKVYKVSVPLENILGKWHNIGLSLIYIMRIIKVIPLLFSLPRDFDIICATSHYLPEVLPAVMILQRNPRSKFVVYVHHLEPSPWIRARGQPLLPRILSWINEVLSLWLIKRYARLIVTVSPPVKNELISKGISEARIQLFPNGIDMESINSAESAEEKYEVCYFGRLAPSKGILDIIDIWADIRQSYPEARVAIMGGDGEGYVSQIKDRIKANNLEESVVLLGLVPEEKKYALIKACKVSISPSYEEGWGIAVCEALACGLPVVAYDLPAYQVFGDEAMIKVPVGDKKAFSEAILRLLSNDNLRCEIGRKAREVASHFSWDKVAREELTQLSSLAQGAKR